MGHFLRMAIAFLLLAPSPARAAGPPILAVAFAPDGKTLIVASQRDIAILEWPGLHRSGAQPETPWPTNTIRFSPDGRQLASGGGLAGELGEVRVYDYPSWELCWSDESHDDVIYDIAWHPGGDQLATASHDGTIRLWDAAGTPQSVLTTHSAAVTGVVYLPEGQLISCSRDRTVRAWDGESATPARTLTNHAGEVWGVVPRPQNSRLPMVASIGDDSTVRFWQPTIGRLVRFAQLQDDPPVASVWTPDGETLLVVTRSGKLLGIDPSTAETDQTHVLSQRWPAALAVHPDGKEAAVGGHPGVIEVVELQRTAAP